MHDYPFRTTIVSAVAFAINMIYAAWQGGLAIYYGSVWYTVLFIYYAVFCLVRGFTIAFERRAGKNTGLDKLSKSLTYYLFTGIMLVLLNIVFAVMLVYMIATGTATRYGVIPAIVAAVYAFYKLCVAIGNAAYAKKYDDYVIRALRNITLVDAVVSMFALEAAMMETFGDGVRGSLFILVVVSGVAAEAVCLAVAVYMMVTSSIKLRRLSEKEAEESSDGEEYEYTE